MLKSMTGFGRGEFEDANFSITVEMKTVNHRYNEVAIRLPRFLNPLEDRIRKTILKTVSRGRGPRSGHAGCPAAGHRGLAALPAGGR